MKTGTKVGLGITAVIIGTGISGCVSTKKFDEYANKTNKAIESLRTTTNVHAHKLESLENDIAFIFGSQNEVSNRLHYLNLRLEAISPQYGFSKETGAAAIKDFVDSVAALSVRTYQKLTPNPDNLPISDSLLDQSIRTNLVAAISNPDFSGRDSVIIKSKTFTPADVDLFIKLFVLVRDQVHQASGVFIRVKYSHDGYNEDGSPAGKGKGGEPGVKLVINDRRIIEKIIKSYAAGAIPQLMNPQNGASDMAPAETEIPAFQDDAIKGVK